MKKNIIILMLIPFLIALFSVITVNATVDIISPDILSIEWDYKDHEGFKKSDYLYELKAIGNTVNDIKVAEGNQLVFEVKNKDESVENPLAEITYTGGHYYLKTLDLGDVIITCRNKKGNVFKTMTATIYDKGAILVNPEIKGSQNNIDTTLYYGAYDYTYNAANEESKVPASFKLNFDTLPSSLAPKLTVNDYSRDIIDSVNLETGEVKIKRGASGKAFIEFIVTGNPDIKNVKYEFEVVKDGVNIYTYKDLLNATNFSKDGEVVVLRKSFESNATALDETNSLRHNNIEVFGTYNTSNKLFNFQNEVYQFETTFNDEYIKSWNEFASKNRDYKPISNKVKAGLHVQKDFYGNGYTVNMHNLTYPSEQTQLENGVVIPTLGKNDLFRGPLPFYTLGDPNGLPLITAFGQDNVGMYVDGDNITINDVNLKNCDMENSLSNLTYVGTVMDINGDNNKVINSRLSNGKNVLRAFSTNNLNIDNCMLQNSRNFLVQVGTNEYIPIEGQDEFNFLDSLGVVDKSSIDDYLSKGSSGDKVMNDFLTKTFETEQTRALEKDTILRIQNALNQSSKVEDQYKCSVNINDTLFYRSGIASISLDTLFNGPFLYLASPSYINDIFGQISFESKPVVPLTPKYVSGLSYPSKVNVSGKTKFYDYKDIKKMDITGLIHENISTIAKDFIDSNENIGDAIGGKIPEINIDKIFPIKKMLENVAGSKYSYSETKDNQTTKYVNVPFAYYGGGLNLSSVNFDTLEYKTKISPKLDVNLLDEYLKLAGSEAITTQAKNMLLKCVTVVTGFEPFNFVLMDNEGYLFGETPSVNELKANFKEE